MGNLLRIFISSTSDLYRWRVAANDALKKLNICGVKFEDWSASPNCPLNECLTRVKESDAFILLIKNKYGTIVNDLSITHHEYRTAKKNCIPVFAFKLPRPGKLENGMEKFLLEIENVKTGHYRYPVKNIKDLRTQIKISLSTEMIRSFKVAHLPPENMISENKTIFKKHIVYKNLPTDKRTLINFLHKKYKSGEDEFIVGLYDQFNSIPNVDITLLNFCFLSGINLGLNNYKVNNGLVRRAISFWTKNIKTVEIENLPDLQYNIGNAYYVLGDLANAILHYSEALKLKPEYPDCLKNYGSVLESLGNHKEAVKMFNKVIQINPLHPQAIFALAVHYIQESRKYRQGLQLLSGIPIRTCGSRINLLILKWRAYANIKLKNYQQAIADLEQINFKKEDTWLHNNLSFCYKMLSKISTGWKLKAKEYFRKYIIENDESANAWYELGELNYVLGYSKSEIEFFREAIDCYQKALDRKIDSSSGILWDHLGHSFDEIGETFKSIESFKNAQLRNKNEFTYCLVKLLIKSEHYQEALPFALKDARQYHKDAKSWYQLGICYLKLNKIINANQALLKAISLDKNYPYPIYELGGLYWNQGKKIMAIKIWKKALKRFPSFKRSTEVKKNILAFNVLSLKIKSKNILKTITN